VRASTGLWAREAPSGLIGCYECSRSFAVNASAIAAVGGRPDLAVHGSLTFWLVRRMA
jgi:hypothetical protein